MSNSIFPILSFVILITGSSAAETAGYAAPLKYGPVSTASTAIFGSAGLKVKYCITEVTGDTQICCNGANGQGTFQSIGCFTSHSTGCSLGQIEWGANINYPKVQCRGNVLGSTYKWKV